MTDGNQTITSLDVHPSPGAFARTGEWSADISLDHTHRNDSPHRELAG